MAKSLRSKIKRHFRTSAGRIVKGNAEMEEHQARKEREQAAIVAAPRPEQPEDMVPGAASMDMIEDVDAVIGTTKNPGKIAKKLAAHRRATLKGLHEKETKKKSGSGLTIKRTNKMKPKKKRR
jgi:hypothetical protein